MLLIDRRPRLILLVFCLLCWLPGFFTLPPSDRDESRFAQATKQMVETRDFVRIRDGERARNKKPIGIYWLQAPFAEAFGRHRIWAYRMPSLLGALAAVMLTYALGLRLGGRRTAMLAAAMLGGSTLLTVEAHIAKTDAALLGATTAAMLVLARAYLDPGGISWQLAAGFWLALGAGILIKGPITPMVVVLCAGVLVLWDRRAAWLLTLRPRWGVPLLFFVVVPWFVAIGIVTQGRFFVQAVGGDLGKKLIGGAESHWGPPGLHLLLVALLLLPGSALVPGGLVAAWRGRADPRWRFLLAWATPSWLVFELVPTKLPHYPLPLYPALCLMAASWAAERMRDGRLDPRWAVILGRGLAVTALAVLGAAAIALPIALHQAVSLGILGALAAAIVGIALVRRGVVLALAAMPLVYWAVLAIELPRLSPLWLSPRAVVAAEAAGSGVLGTVNYDEPSLRFLAGTGTVFLSSGIMGAQALASGQVSRIFVGDGQLAAFRAEAARLHLHVRDRRTIRGFDYSRGRWVTLTLFGR